MSGRIEKLQNQFKSQLEIFVRQQSKNPNLSSEEIWNTFIEADHTLNNKNLRWMVETILDKGFLWEDIKDGKNSKVFDTLKLFDRLKKNLPEEKRSLIHYKSLGKLYTTIEPYIVKSKVENRDEEKQKAYAESKIFIDRNGLKIVSPQTKYAAKFWGRGTQWCTSAEKNNMFEEYNECGPLLICITPDGRKFQAWKPLKIDHTYDKEDSQFMDEYDEIIDNYDLSENWNYLKSICYYLNNIDFFPENKLSKEIKLNIYRENYKSINLEDTDIDDNFIYSLVETEKDFVFFIFVDNNDIVSDINSNHTWSQYTESKDFIIHCIKNNLPSISYILLNSDNDKFIMDYLTKNYKIKEYYQYLPSFCMTEEMSNEIMNNNPELFKYVPCDHQKIEFINKHKQYFIDNPQDISYIKNEFLNKEHIKYLLKNTNVLNHGKINPEIIDDEIADLLSISNGVAFVNIPEHFKTYERYTNLAKIQLTIKWLKSLFNQIIMRLIIYLNICKLKIIEIFHIL